MSEGEMVGRLYLPIEVDLPQFEADLRRAENQARKMGQGFQGWEAIGKRMTDLGRTLTMAITLPLAAAGAAAVKFGMDSVETENLFRVSMGEMAGQAEAWAKSLSQSLGLNRFDLMKNVGTLNVMLGSMGLAEQAAYDMATGLTQLTYDLASFFNLSTSDAFQKVRAALAGEVEPMRQLGIVIDDATIKQIALRDGIIDTNREMTQAEKVQARYIAIMEQTTKAQGDLARTADSPANQLRRLQERMKELAADIGRDLLPIVSALFGGLRNLADGFANLSPAMRGVIEGILTSAAALGPFLFLWGNMLTLIPKLVAGFQAIAASVGMAAGPFGWVLLAITAATAGFMALNNAHRAHIEKTAQDAGATDSLTGRLESLRKKLDDVNTPQGERNQLLQDEKDIMDQLDEILPKNIGTRNEYGELISVTTDDLKAFNTELQKEKTAHEEAAKAILQQELAALRLRREILAGNAVMATGDNSGDVAPTTAAGNPNEMESLNRQIEATEAKLASLSTTVVGDDTKKGGGGGGGGNVPVVTALERLRRAYSDVAKEGEILRLELGIVDGSFQAAQFDSEQLTRLMDAQAAVVRQATKDYEALAKAKGYANDATREAYSTLLDEKKVLAELRAQIEAEKPAMPTEGQAEAAGSFFKLLESTPNFAESRRLYNQVRGISGIQGEVEYTQKLFQMWKDSGMRMEDGKPVVVNVNGVNDPEAVRRAAKQGVLEGLQEAGRSGGGD